MVEPDALAGLERAVMASASTASTPMILVSGRTRLM
jgi:hypothetical protein